jgi:ATP-binding cassette, subfamily C, bacterial LapB
MMTGQCIARGRADASRPRYSGALVAGLALSDGLIAAARHLGLEATSSQLLSGLPMAPGRSLEFRLAPIALARLGLQTEVERLNCMTMSDDQCPALLHLLDDSVVLVESIATDGLRIIASGGATVMSRRELAALADGTGMVLGQAVRLEASAPADDSQLVQTQPRRWILMQFLAEKSLFVQLAIVAILLNLSALVVPLYMRAIYDRVVPNLAMETLWALSLGVLIMLCIEYALKGVKATFSDAIAIRIGLLVQHRVMKRLLGARLADAPRQSGAVLSILRDVEQIATLIPAGIITLLIDLPFFLLFLVIVHAIGGPVVLSVILGALVIAAGGVLAHNRLESASRKVADLTRVRSNMIVDTVEGLATVKVTHTGGRILGQWDLLADHLALGQRRIRDWSDKPTHLAAFAMQMVTVGVIIIGLFEIKAGNLSVGGMIACTLLCGRAMMPVCSAVQILGRMQQSLSIFAGLARLLALPQEPEASAQQVAPMRGDLRCANVSVMMTDRQVPVLKGLNLRIQRGERVGIIGKSGCGKSTLLNLLAGLVTASDGQVTLDGRDLRQYPAEQLRQNMGYALQDAMLFNGSMEDNLYGFGTAPETETVRAVLEATGLDRLSDRHPEGLRMAIGPRGQRLSGGQRQALSLARTLLQPAELLLLDEPTAAMDVATEAMVIAGLKKLTHGRTLIVATHRLTLLELVDRVIWLEDGRIVADKPRDDILALFQKQQKAANAA